MFLESKIIFFFQTKNFKVFMSILLNSEYFTAIHIKSKISSNDQFFLSLEKLYLKKNYYF